LGEDRSGEEQCSEEQRDVVAEAHFSG